jgi:hypothetical protein
LGGTGNHVLNKITMAGGINDGDVVLGGFELPQGNVNGNTTFTFSLELVQDPGVLERALAHFGGFLLELFNGTLVNTTALVDQVTGGGGLAGVDVTNDDDVNMVLFFTHVVGGGACFQKKECKLRKEESKIFYSLRSVRVISALFESPTTPQLWLAAVYWHIVVSCATDASVLDEKDHEWKVYE